MIAQRINSEKNEPRHRVGPFYTLWGAWYAYRSDCAQIDRNWNQNTQEEYEKIVKTKIVPNVANHDMIPIHSYTYADFMKVLDGIEQTGKKNAERYEQETLDKYRHIIVTLIKVASQKENFQNVFDFAVESDGAEETMQTRIEQMQRIWLTPKSLTVVQEQKIGKYIQEAIRQQRGEAIALLLMFAFGLRNAEACGVNFGNIFEMKEYPGHYYLMIPQTTQIHSNVLKPSGKTYNTARSIPIPSSLLGVFRQLQEDRLEKLRHDGKDKDVDDLPIAYRRGNIYVRCSADDVYEAAKEMFSALGMRHEIRVVGQYIQQDFSAATEDSTDLDEFALIEKDPTAYLLRRNFATHLAILQLSEAQISYVMGHVIMDPQTKRRDFVDERELYNIKMKLDERPYIYFTAAEPMVITEDEQSVAIDRYDQTFVIRIKGRHVHLQVSAKEPTDKIVVTTSLSEGACAIKKQVYVHRTPCPCHFEDGADVRKAYHKAFEKMKD